MPNRKSRTISFTPEQATFVSKCLDSGRFQSASEVIRAGLRLLQQEENLRRAELERARALIQVGADQLDRGEVVDGDAFFEAWEEKHAALAEADAA